MRTNGADAISFEPIVGSGPLSAHIHHTPSERVASRKATSCCSTSVRVSTAIAAT